jgi:hypothetical protein
MNWKMQALRFLLALVCIVNLGLGAAAFTSESTILKVIQTVYRVPLTDLDGTTLYVIKMVGCYIIAIAVMSGWAIRNPVQNRIIVLGNVIWLMLRGIQRLTYVERFHRDWGIPYSQLWGQIVLVFLLAALLFWLMPKKQETV